MNKIIVIALSISFCITLVAQQKVAPRPRMQQYSQTDGLFSGFYGELYGEYMYVVQEPQNGDPTTTTSGRNAFDLSRATIGYHYVISRDLSVSASYDASANYIQEGFIAVNNIVPMVEMDIGMMQTPASSTISKIWGYRSLGQSIINRNGFAQEYDLGMKWRFVTNPRGTSYANLMVGNGTGTLTENDKDKKIYLSAGNWFDRSNVLELYGDYENVGQGKSTLTGKILYGVTMPLVSFGVEGFIRINRKFTGLNNDIVPAGGSLFGWFSMDRTVRGVVRVDFVDDDIKVAYAGTRTVYVDAGIDYMPSASAVHLIPNIEYTTVLEKGGTTTAPAAIITIRLTAAVSVPDIK